MLALIIGSLFNARPF